MIAPETERATVYRADGRRWFTLRAACNAAARKLIRDHYCEPCEFNGRHHPEDPPDLCPYHQMDDEVRERRDRLADYLYHRARRSA